MTIQVLILFFNYSQDKDGITQFKWDTHNIGVGIQVTEDNTKVFLKEGPYMFRTAIGDQVYFVKKLFYNIAFLWRDSLLGASS